MSMNLGMPSFCQDLAVGGGGVGYGNPFPMLEGNIGNGVRTGELGFLEMLGVGMQIPFGCMLEEMDHREVMSMQTSVMDQVSAVAGFGRQLFEERSNAPGTPNSSSISLASNNEGVVAESEHEVVAEDEDQEDGDEEEERAGQEGSVMGKKLLKAKKGNFKKPRPPRFAFMTKSEVDNLEDGYRWRKYGQKAVKNSPFPRSYYRCTNASCAVKKRVERSCSDTSIVVTTYEGRHTHQSPLTPRSISSAIFQESAVFAALQMNLHSCYQQQQQPPLYFATPLDYNTYPAIETLTTSSRTPSSTSFTHSHTSGNLGYNRSNQGFLRVKDDGLLQDLIPSLLSKEE